MAAASCARFPEGAAFSAVHGTLLQPLLQVAIHLKMDFSGNMNHGTRCMGQLQVITGYRLAS